MPGYTTAEILTRDRTRELRAEAAQARLASTGRDGGSYPDIGKALRAARSFAAELFGSLREGADTRLPELRDYPYATR